MNPVPLLPALSSSPTAQALVLAAASSQMTMRKMVYRLKKKAQADHAADVKRVTKAHKKSVDDIVAEAIKASV